MRCTRCTHPLLGPLVNLLVRSLNGIIVTNRVQAPNLAQMFLWVYKTNLEGVPRDPKSPGGGGGGGQREGSSISVDLFQDGNEADESCAFTCVSPPNVTSSFGTNVLMGKQSKLRRGATRSDIPGRMARNSISEDLFQHGYESLHASLPQMLSQT